MTGKKHHKLTIDQLRM
jgi:hypothetical protein